MLQISTTQQGVIGNCTVDDFTLKPGDNKLPMSAIVDESLALKSMQPNGLVDLMIIGQTSVYNGVHLPYFVRIPRLIDHPRDSTDIVTL